MEEAAAEGDILHCQPPASPSSPFSPRLRGTDPSGQWCCYLCVYMTFSPRTDHQPMDSADTLGLGFSLLFLEKRNWAVELIFCCFCF